LNLKQDGKFGAGTLKALKAFQVKNKIAKPGVAGYGQVGPKTREVLNRIWK
jgi:peptidoglycan hydrolase-like protein with peptidoglycan-binding domain